MSYLNKSRDFSDLNRRSYTHLDNFSSPHRLGEGADHHSRLYRDFTDPDLRRHTTGLYDGHKDPISISTDVLSLESKLANKDVKVQELERELRNRSEVEESQYKTIKQLKEVLSDFEREKLDISTVHSKAQLAVGTLQADNRQLQERVLELEDRLKRHLEDKEMTGKNALQWERHYEDVRHCLAKSLFQESALDIRSHDTLMRRLHEHLDLHSDMKSRLMKLEDNLAAAEHELKSNRENHKRLFEDFDKTKKYVAATDIMKEERDISVRRQKAMEDEIKNLEKQLIESRDKYDKLLMDIRHQEVKVSEYDSQVKRNALSAQATTQEFKSFKETLAAILHDGFAGTHATEEAIKEKIRTLMLNKQDVNKVTHSLEEKLKELSKQLEEQAHLHKTAVQRARKSEDDVDRLKDRLKGAEGELSATDILKDGLKIDKHRYVEFLDKLSHVMKMDAITRELGMELNGDSLLARAEQLTKIEEELLGKKSSQLLTLQKQVQNSRKQLESKDLHLEVLRKKLVTLEHESSHRAEKDYQEVIERNLKLSKHVDKLQKQLLDSKRHVNGFKVESVAYETLKDTCDEQRKALLEMEQKLVELEQVRVKQSRKIASLKNDKDLTENEAQQGIRITESAVQSLSNEVQRLKQRLEEVQKREKQLLDLRQVIARMLGLDVGTLAVPDYEIITRLEKLIEAQHELSLATNKMKTDLHSQRHHGDQSESYKKDYVVEAQRRLGQQSRHGRWK